MGANAYHHNELIFASQSIDLHCGTKMRDKLACQLFYQRKWYVVTKLINEYQLTMRNMLGKRIGMTKWNEFVLFATMRVGWWICLLISTSDPVAKIASNCRCVPLG